METTTKREQMNTPQPPLLFLNKGKKFWVQDAPLEESHCTKGAIKNGVYEGALLFDARGAVWKVAGAELARKPSAIESLLPWSQLPVSLHIEQEETIRSDEVIEEVKQLLDSESDFAQQLGAQRQIIKENIRQAETPEQIIIAAKPARP